MAAIIRAVARQLGREEARRAFWTQVMDIFCVCAASLSFILLLQLC